MTIRRDEPDGSTAGSDGRLTRQQAYQHFHIGIYVTLASAIIGASFLRGETIPEHWIVRYGLAVVIVFLLLAGMCGGMVAAKLANAATFKDFADAEIGFSLPGSDVSRPKRKPEIWESWEHLFFWIAMFVLGAIGTVIIVSPRQEVSTRPPVTISIQLR